MPDAHSIFSPSAATRWMSCPGSVRLSEGVPDTTSVYAAEGTVAHSICEQSLMFGVPASSFLGHQIAADTQTFEVTQEMVDSCQVFVDYVNDKVNENTDYELEQRIISKSDDRFGGTVDCVIRERPLGDLSNDGEPLRPLSLDIVDFKFGAGLPVEAVGNPQLLCYAALAWRGESEITMTIVQPRCRHSEGPIRSWTIEREELEKFLVDVNDAIDRVDQLVELPLADLPLKTGDHCRWCKALPNCPQQYKETIEEAMGDFAPVVELDEDRRVSIMNRAGQIKAYLAAVEESLSSQLLAGGEVSGYKLVQSLGNRQWALSEEELFKKLRSKKIKKSESTVAKLKSPAQMEKIRSLDKEWVAQFVERPLSNPKMVPESDKREPYFPPKPQDDFEPIERTESEIAANTEVPEVPDFMM